MDIFEFSSHAKTQEDELARLVALLADESSTATSFDSSIDALSQEAKARITDLRMMATASGGGAFEQFKAALNSATLIVGVAVKEAGAAAEAATLLRTAAESAPAFIEHIRGLVDDGASTLDRAFAARDGLAGVNTSIAAAIAANAETDKKLDEAKSALRISTDAKAIAEAAAREKHTELAQLERHMSDLEHDTKAAVDAVTAATDATALVRSAAVESAHEHYKKLQIATGNFNDASAALKNAQAELESVRLRSAVTASSANAATLKIKNFVEVADTEAKREAASRNFLGEVLPRDLKQIKEKLEATKKSADGTRRMLHASLRRKLEGTDISGTLSTLPSTASGSATALANLKGVLSAAEDAANAAAEANRAVTAQLSRLDEPEAAARATASLEKLSEAVRGRAATLSDADISPSLGAVWVALREIHASLVMQDAQARKDVSAAKALMEESTLRAHAALSVSAETDESGAAATGANEGTPPTTPKHKSVASSSSAPAVSITPYSPSAVLEAASPYTLEFCGDENLSKLWAPSPAGDKPAALDRWLELAHHTLRTAAVAAGDKPPSGTDAALAVLPKTKTVAQLSEDSSNLEDSLSSLSKTAARLSDVVEKGLSLPLLAFGRDIRREEDARAAAKTALAEKQLADARLSRSLAQTKGLVGSRGKVEGDALRDALNPEVSRAENRLNDVVSGAKARLSATISTFNERVLEAERVAAVELEGVEQAHESLVEAKADAASAENAFTTLTGLTAAPRPAKALNFSMAHGVTMALPSPMSLSASESIDAMCFKAPSAPSGVAAEVKPTFADGAGDAGSDASSQGSVPIGPAAAKRARVTHKFVPTRKNGSR